MSPGIIIRHAIGGGRRQSVAVFPWHHDFWWINGHFVLQDYGWKVGTASTEQVTAPPMFLAVGAQVHFRDDAHAGFPVDDKLVGVSVVLV